MLRLRKTVELNATSCSNAPAGPLWESKIYLGEAFFNEIISHPVPIDMNTLTALKRSSLGLDLYLWLWCTVLFRFALRNRSLGVRCTVSSEHIQTRPTTT